MVTHNHTATVVNNTACQRCYSVTCSSEGNIEGIVHEEKSAIYLVHIC